MDYLIKDINFYIAACDCTFEFLYEIVYDFIDDILCYLIIHIYAYITLFYRLLFLVFKCYNKLNDPIFGLDFNEYFNQLTFICNLQ